MFILILFVRTPRLLYPLYDDSDDSYKEEYEKLGPESGSNGTYGTRLSGFLRCTGLPVGVTLSVDDDGGSWDGDRSSLDP